MFTSGLPAEPVGGGQMIPQMKTSKKYGRKKYIVCTTSAYTMIAGKLTDICDREERRDDDEGTECHLIMASDVVEFRFAAKEMMIFAKEFRNFTSTRRIARSIDTTMPPTTRLAIEVAGLLGDFSGDANTSSRVIWLNEGECETEKHIRFLKRLASSQSTDVIIDSIDVTPYAIRKPMHVDVCAEDYPDESTESSFGVEKTAHDGEVIDPGCDIENVVRAVLRADPNLLETIRLMILQTVDKPEEFLCDLHPHISNTRSISPIDESLD